MLGCRIVCRNRVSSWNLMFDSVSIQWFNSFLTATVCSLHSHFHTSPYPPSIQKQNDQMSLLFKSGANIMFTLTDRFQPLDLWLIDLPQVCQEFDLFLFVFHQLLNPVISGFSKLIQNQQNGKWCHGQQYPKQPVSRYHCSLECQLIDNRRAEVVTEP